jgi:ketosteroid isomerase-like protein
LEKTLKRILTAAAILALSLTSAVATETTDVLLIGHEWADTFTRGGFSTGNSPCADDAVIIDDLPPHVWQGSGACSKWYKAFSAWAAKTAVTDASITLGATSRVEVTSGYAYIVTPVTLPFLKGGKPVKDAGVLTMTLRKAGSGWRIAGFAWADQ